MYRVHGPIKSKPIINKCYSNLPTKLVFLLNLSTKQALQCFNFVLNVDEILNKWTNSKCMYLNIERTLVKADSYEYELLRTIQSVSYTHLTLPTILRV